MKCIAGYTILSALLLAGTSAAPQSQSHRRLQQQPLPVQTYFVPLPEKDLLQTLQTVNDDVAGNIVTLISVAVARNNTILWYDHWEDGYETDVTNPTQRTTLVIGDGDVSNGALPGITQDADDVLFAGSSIILENTVPVNNNAISITFDARDKLQTSFPIAVTRGAYPEMPGSLFAGAVEVQDTDNWGVMFEIPVGPTTEQQVSTMAFELTEVYIMAQEDNTNVTLPDGSFLLLQQGESANFDAQQGDVVQSTRPIQTDILVADQNAKWELRWYSLLPREDWSTEYYTPVGTTNKGETVAWLYNPNDEEITVTSNIGGPYIISPKGTIRSNGIPEESGARFTSADEKDFFGIVQVDADWNPDGPSGQEFDWGHPLIPSDQLTSQALIGLGYGCTSNDCDGDKSKSVVFAMPVQDATVCVDFDNNGFTNDRDVSFALSALQGKRISDDADNDMSGALIYGIQDGTCAKPGTPVDIAVAWGQDPSTILEGADHFISLDLGTVVVPFPEIEASKSVTLKDTSGDGEVNTGDVLVYTILVQNTGKIRISAGAFLVRDFLPEGTSYVAGSATYDSGSGPKPIDDDSTGSAFPLDDDGLALQARLKPNKPHSISFEVTVNSINELSSGTTEIINEGDVYANGNPDSPDDTFRTVTPLVFHPSIAIDNLATLGPNGDCNLAVDRLEVPPFADVTYCFTISNDGDTFLNTITITDAVLEGRGSDFVGVVPTILAPGEDFSLMLDNNIDLDFFLNNIGVVTALPTFSDGQLIPNMGAVQDEDDSTVEIVTAEPTVSPTEAPTNLPTDAPSNEPSVAPSEEPSSVPSEMPSGEPSMSPSHVPSESPSGAPSASPSAIPSVTPSASPSTRPSSKPSLRPSSAPSASPSMSPSDSPSPMPSEYPSTVPSEMPSVVASDIPSSMPSEGPSAVASEIPSTMPSPNPTLNPTMSYAAVQIINTVLPLANGGDECPGYDSLVAEYGTSLTYCFEIINIGDTPLTNIEVVNPDLELLGAVIEGDIPNFLPPGGSFVVYVEDMLTTDLMNNATVKATRATDDRDPPGEMLPVVSDTDDSVVEVVTREPTMTPTTRPTCPYADVDIENSVYAGHDNGASCAGDELVTAFIGANVTYCFVVTNNGGFPLTNITLGNNDLLNIYNADIKGIIPDVLQPQDSFTVYIEETLREDLINTATVMANPINTDGSPAPPRFSQVTDFDTSAVEAILRPNGDAPTTAPITCQVDVDVTCHAAVFNPMLKTSTTEQCRQRPNAISFKYIGGGCNQGTQDQLGAFECQDDADAGPPPTSGSATITVANRSGRNVYFSDSIDSGEAFEVYGPGDRQFGGYTSVTIEVEGKVRQSFVIHTGCSDDFALNDIFGALQVVGYRNEEQGDVSVEAIHDGVEMIPCSEFRAPESLSCYDRPTAMSFKYVGGDCTETTNEQFGRLSCIDANGGAPTTGMVNIEVTSTPGGSRSTNAITTYFSGDVSVGETFGLDISMEGISSRVRFIIREKGGGKMLQDVIFQASCSKPLAVFDRFGALQLMSYANDAQGTVSGEIDAIYTYTVTRKVADTTAISVVVDSDGGASSILLENGDFAVDSDELVVTESRQVLLTQQSYVSTTKATVTGIVGIANFDCDTSIDVPIPALPEKPDKDGLCETRPTEMSLTYLGGDCDQTTNNQNGAYSCETIDPVAVTSGKAATLTITNRSGNVSYFASSVDVGETFALNTGGNRMTANVRVVVEIDGSVVQTVMIHSSCSKDLFAGDIFGSLQLYSFVNARQGSVTMALP